MSPSCIKGLHRNACYNDDMTVRIWDKSTGQLQHSLVHTYECYNFHISPNGKFIAVANGDFWKYGLTVWSLTENYDKLAKLDVGEGESAWA